MYTSTPFPLEWRAAVACSLPLLVRGRPLSIFSSLLVTTMTPNTKQSLAIDAQKFLVSHGFLIVVQAAAAAVAFAPIRERDYAAAEKVNRYRMPIVWRVIPASSTRIDDQTKRISVSADPGRNCVHG